VVTGSALPVLKERTQNTVASKKDDSAQKSDKEITISVSSLARWATDVSAILALLAFILGPAWYFSVSHPIDQLKSDVAKIKIEMDQRSTRINQIDKNVAVILERTERQEDSLNSIRRFLENLKNQN